MLTQKWQICIGDMRSWQGSRSRRACGGSGCGYQEWGERGKSGVTNPTIHSWAQNSSTVGSSGSFWSNYGWCWRLGSREIEKICSLYRPCFPGTHSPPPSFSLHPSFFKNPSIFTLDKSPRNPSERFFWNQTIRAVLKIPFVIVSLQLLYAWRA